MQFNSKRDFMLEKKKRVNFIVQVGPGYGLASKDLTHTPPRKTSALGLPSPAGARRSHTCPPMGVYSQPGRRGPSPQGQPTDVGASHGPGHPGGARASPSGRRRVRPPLPCPRRAERPKTRESVSPFVATAFWESSAVSYREEQRAASSTQQGKGGWWQSVGRWQLGSRRLDHPPHPVWGFQVTLSFFTSWVFFKISTMAKYELSF